ncbi:MAG TPA: DUF502 domain-containing protein [Cyclobacteriaceae bacterium]|nr:DUF502 domain-containing protein [Cyclobacteriaceae bacterium]
MKSFLRSVLRYFFGGMLFIVPIVATAYFIVTSLLWLDNLLRLPYRGLGVIIIVAAITLIGYLTSIFFVKTVTDWLDHLVNRIPFVKLIYSSIKDLLGAFVGDKKKFTKPVLVTINKDNQLYRIGFITQNDLTDLGLKDFVMVYFPQSYAVAGDHYVVPKESIKPLDVPGPVAMKLIVSGGVSGFKE